MDEETKNEIIPKYIWAVLAAVALVSGRFFVFQRNQKEKPIAPAGTKPMGIDKEKVAEIKKFGSVQEFKDYIMKDKSVSGFYGGRGGAGGPGPMEMSAKSSDALNLPQATGLGAGPSRISETNVQVAGVDEPDAVKTDGKEIYFSVPRPEIMPMDDTVGRPDESRELFPLQQPGGTKEIKAFPQTNMESAS